MDEMGLLNRAMPTHCRINDYGHSASLSISIKFRIIYVFIKNMLLKYSKVAIASNINDSVLLALLRGIKDQLL
jgi:hypothetical protein